MKKRLLFVFFLCLTGASVLFAQQGENDKKERTEKRGKEQTEKIKERAKSVKENFEKFKIERTEFISRKMNLTEEEKKDFWLLADELHLKKFELNKSLRKEIRKIHEARKEKQPISDAEYKKVIELSAQTKMKEAQLEQEYLAKFIKVVSAEKIFIYQEAELLYGKTIMERREKREHLPTHQREWKKRSN
jgi:hypothetical protein